MQELEQFCGNLATRLQLDKLSADVRSPMTFAEAETLFADASIRESLLLQGCEIDTGAFATLRRLIRDYDLARVCPDFYRRHTLTPETWATMDEDALDDLEAMLKRESLELQNARGIVWAFCGDELEKKTLKRPPGRKNSGSQFLCKLLALADIERSRKLILIGYSRSDVPPKPSEPTRNGLRVPTPLDGLGYDKFELRSCDKRGGLTASVATKGGVREAVHPGTVLYPSLVVITEFTLEDEVMS